MIGFFVFHYQSIDSCPRLPASGWSLPPSPDSFRLHPCLSVQRHGVFRGAERWAETSFSPATSALNRARHLHRRRLSRRSNGWQKQNRWTSSLRLSNRGTRTLLSRTTRRSPGCFPSQLCGAGQVGKSGRPHFWKRNTGARSSDCCRAMQICMKQP